MNTSPAIRVIIPALNEQKSIAQVLGAIPLPLDQVIVVNNGSTDATAEIAGRMGANVIREPRRGYGSACLSGIEAAGRVDILVFLDADFADDPAQLPLLLRPVVEGRSDMIIGSRALGVAENGAMTVPQRFGNWLACALVNVIWGHHYTDLGPFRVIRRDALEKLQMQDRDFGWTVEMQVRAVSARLRVAEVPVSYRRRVGVSKISGTVRGVLSAGYKILYVIAREAWLSRRVPPLTKPVIPTISGLASRKK